MNIYRDTERMTEEDEKSSFDIRPHLKVDPVGVRMILLLRV